MKDIHVFKLKVINGGDCVPRRDLPQRARGSRLRTRNEHAHVLRTPLNVYT